MYEVISVAAGALLGLALVQVDGRLTRRIALVVGSQLIGLAAAFLTGEIAGSVLFVALDAVQALLAATAVVAIAPRLTARRRATSGATR